MKNKRTAWNKGLPNTWYNPIGLKLGHGWNKGLHLSEKTKEKLRIFNLGKKHSEKTKEKLRIMFSGKNHYNWRGGITPIVYALRRSLKYRNWRFQVFKRDRFTCVQCGDNKGGNLEADHVISFSELIQDLAINTYEKGINSIALWDTLNGRTLCESCHKLTQNWGKTKKYVFAI